MLRRSAGEPVFPPPRYQHASLRPRCGEKTRGADGFTFATASPTLVSDARAGLKNVLAVARLGAPHVKNVAPPPVALDPKTTAREHARCDIAEFTRRRGPSRCRRKGVARSRRSLSSSGARAPQLVDRCVRVAPVTKSNGVPLGRRNDA